MRRVLLIASVLLLLGGFFVVPLPMVETSPGTVADVAELVTVEGEPGEINGELNLLTVKIRQPSIAETLRALVSDARELQAREALLPPDIPRREFFELQEEEFRRTFEVAAAVGMRAAGLDVEITTAPQVVMVLDDGPADGTLRIGDVIESYNGTPVSSAEELASLTRQATVGDELRLTVERGDERMEVTVTAGRLPGLERAGIGVTLQTLEEDIVLPVDVELADQRGIGGPSAGLMTALTVYDLVSDEDLAAGRVLAGTGTVDGDGTVGRIGSVREKTLGAIAEDATVMLVPASQAAEAGQWADGRLEVIGVATVEEAIGALRDA